MRRIRKILAFSALAAILSGGVAFAQDHHDNQQYVHHQEWKKGAHIKQEDWSRGDQVNYQQHHLRKPPNGYEWRQVDGNYVLAGSSTGLISSVVVSANVR